MKKLALELDTLLVETFEPETRPESDGTVMAYASTGGWWECNVQCVTSPDMEETMFCTYACQESIDYACTGDC